MTLSPIATFHSPFSSKFGIPKQSGLVESLEGSIVFEPGYRNAEALRGLEDFDFLWLIWGFSANKHAATGTTVRPPVLGGNVRMGVWATRSPFRPNPIGLSSVRISHIDLDTPRGPIIYVHGADLMDGTPIYDIKPYVAYADSHPDARSGFVDRTATPRLDVELPTELAERLGERQAATLREVLALDPRPHYHHDPDKVYGMPFDGHDIHFRVVDGRVIVLV